MYTSAFSCLSIRETPSQSQHPLFNSPSYSLSPESPASRKRHPDWKIKSPLVTFVYRRPLKEFKKPGDEQDIIDPVVRRLVSQRLTSIGPSVAPFGPNAAPLLHTDGRTPIRSVRVRKVMKPGTYHSVRDGSGRVIKVHAYDNNHHVEVLERGGKRVGIFVTMMEAAQRSAKNIPIVQRSGPWSVMDRTYDDTWRFVMALHINDTIRLNEQLYRIQKLDASNNRVVLRALNDARTGHQGEVQKAINQLRGDLVVIDPLGQVRSHAPSASMKSTVLTGDQIPTLP